MAEDDNKRDQDAAQGATTADASTPVIVAIGASAGGIQALQSFFAAIPDHTGAAFVVIMHLEPRHRSELAAILAARTRMPVVQVEGQEKLLADRVYVISSRSPFAADRS